MKKMGPRKQRRSQQYLTEAEASLLAEKMEQEDKEKKAIEAARFAPAGRGVVATSVPSLRPSCLDVGTDFGKENESGGYWYEPTGFVKNSELCDGQAVTYWASRLPAEGKRRQHFPAKNCVFTNDLQDGRLRHEEGTDYYLHGK